MFRHDSPRPITMIWRCVPALHSCRCDFSAEKASFWGRWEDPASPPEDEAWLLWLRPSIHPSLPSFLIVFPLSIFTVVTTRARARSRTTPSESMGHITASPTFAFTLQSTLDAIWIIQNSPVAPETYHLCVSQLRASVHLPEKKISQWPGKESTFVSGKVCEYWGSIKRTLGCGFHASS